MKFNTNSFDKITTPKIGQSIDYQPKLLKSNLTNQKVNPTQEISISLNHNAFDFKARTEQSRLFNQPNLNLFTEKKQNMFSNRRLKYSSLWAFTSLNYLYADLVGVMDVNLLTQYQTGVVNGIEMTPGFLTGAAAYMQLPLANVFLPHVIKDEKKLRWVQIVSGSIATLVQGATLFVGEPSPYYILFSVIEMGTTAYITYDAIKWKPKKDQTSIDFK